MQTSSYRHPKRPGRPPARRQAAGHARRGIEVFELLIAMPVIIVATFALFEFGFMLLTFQTIATAVDEGVREAARLNTISTSDKLNAVETVVKKYLDAQSSNISLDNDGNILLEDGPNGTSVKLNFINPCSAPSSPATVAANEVRVTVSLRLTNASNRPVPDFLSYFGFSTSGMFYEVSALLPVE